MDRQSQKVQDWKSRCYIHSLEYEVARSFRKKRRSRRGEEKGGIRGRKLFQFDGNGDDGEGSDITTLRAAGWSLIRTFSDCDLSDWGSQGKGVYGGKVCV